MDRPRRIEELHQEWFRKHEKATAFDYCNVTRRPLRAIYEFPDIDQTELDQLNAIIDEGPNEDTVERLAQLLGRVL